MMKIALIQPAEVLEWERGEIDRITGLLQADRGSLGFELVSAADKADLVVLLESCTFKTQHDIPMYKALIGAHRADRLYCINYEDGPPGFLPGLYSSLESFRFDSKLHLSWPHLRLPNAGAETEPVAVPAAERPFLFTFSGACSHPLRRIVFDAFETSPGRHKVREIKRWYDHSAAEKQAYVDDIVNTKFVLCPRGIASYSHRILETMALGRVPVVIADDWVPFSIPESDYLLRVPEREVGDLGRILEAAEGRYEALCQRVREVYQAYYTPTVRYPVALRHLLALKQRSLGKFDEACLLARWNSRSLWRNNGWSLDQRIGRKLRKLVGA